MSESGLLIDFNDIEFSNNTLVLNLYIIGKTTDIDNIINNKNDYKVNAIDTLKLIYNDDNWVIYSIKLNIFLQGLFRQSFFIAIFKKLCHEMSYNLSYASIIKFLFNERRFLRC